MKRNSLLLSVLVALNVIWMSCNDDKGAVSVDCTLSDLALTLESQTDSDCGVGGSVTVAATGGSGSYEFSSDGVNFQSSSELTDLSAGVYTIVVKDSDGCTQTISATVNALPGSVALSVASTQSDCGNPIGTITVTATGGVEPYTFSLNNGAFQASNEFSTVPSGSNEVTVEDADNCQVTRTVLVSSGVSLDLNVMPIIMANCAVTGCHNGTRSPDLRTKTGVINSADRIKARTSAMTMPPADRDDLQQSQIDAIACWVDDGAANN